MIFVFGRKRPENGGEIDIVLRTKGK